MVISKTTMRGTLILTFLLLYFSCFTLIAQEFNPKERFTVVASPAIVHVTHLNLALQPGIQFRFSERLALLSEVAFRIPLNKDTQYTNVKYYRIRSELKFFFDTKREHANNFLALELTYASRSFNSTNDHYFIDQFDNTYNYKKAFVRSPIYIVAVKIGQQRRIGKRTFMDVSGGFGFRNIRTTYSQVEGLVIEPGGSHTGVHIGPVPAHYYHGTRTRPHLTLVVRFHYSL
jgi:Protein of unknown function (DUF3575)